MAEYAGEPVSLDELNLVLLVGALVLLCAVVAVRVSHRVGLPTLLAYLALGLLIGESGLGIEFEDAHLAQILGLCALIFILAEGGLTTKWRDVRFAVPLAAVLATLGVGVSVGVIALAAHYLIGLNWVLSLLLGAVLSPTDAAAVFSVLRRLPLPPRIAGALEAESGFNDAPVVILVLLLSVPGHGSLEPLPLIGTLAYELAIGATAGALVGFGGAYAVRRVALPASGLYPITVLGLTVGAYAGAALVHASGFLATYVAALILGNSRLPHRPATRGFAETGAWLAQIGLFVMLGLLASPGRLPEQIIPALVIAAVLTVLARPASVFLSALPFRWPWREQVFLSWAGLRGAVPIVFATLPLGEGLPGAERLFDLVFVIVFVLTLLQGPTLPWVARRLRLGDSGRAVELDVEAAPLEELQADLLQVRVPEDSRLAGVEIFELRLPKGANVTLVVREGVSFVPGPDTPLSAGDQLLVVTTAAAREVTERRLRAVSRAGKLAGWFGEHGE
ncbi:MAG: potassium/proton antiporter [Streptosporangiales bacterium]|nr:potassium/proton antiporter [Streptosporangiales bacterium]